MMKKRYKILGTILAILLAYVFVTYVRQEILAQPFDQETILNYEIVGEGEQKLVMLHGLAGSHRYWQRGLDSVQDDFQIMMVDLLGFGDSPKPKGSYDLAMHGRALDNTIKHASFDTGDTVILGSSFGTLIALDQIHRNPDWYDGIVLMSMPALSQTQDPRAHLSVAHKLLNNKVIAFFLHPYDFVFANKYIAHGSGLPPAVVSDGTKHTLSSYFGSIDNTLLAIDERIFKPSLRDTQVLVIHGTADTVTPLQYTQSYFQDIDNAQWSIFENAGHHVFHQHTQAVWDVIKETF